MLTAADQPKTAAERGWIALSEKTMNPGLWSSGGSRQSVETMGLKEKPADYDRAVRRRYGLHAAAFDNPGCRSVCNWRRRCWERGSSTTACSAMPARWPDRRSLAWAMPRSTCKGCSRTSAAPASYRLRGPFQFSYARGTIDPINPFTYLMSMHDPDLNLRSLRCLCPIARTCAADPARVVAAQAEETRDWTRLIDVRSTRIDMANLLSPFNGANHVKKHEPVFADIAAFLLTVQPPKYPFPVDRDKAARGQVLFAEHCQKCHGTKESYPNKVIPLDKIGTDPILCRADTQLADHFNKSWLAKEVSADGRLIQLTESIGYQAPPLDGIWATAPLFPQWLGANGLPRSQVHSAAEVLHQVVPRRQGGLRSEVARSENRCSGRAGRPETSGQRTPQGL